PPEVLQMLASAGISLSDLNSLNQKSNNDAATTTIEQPKESLRTQSSNTQEERDFVVRWGEAMLSTVFTSLAVAVQTTDFIDLIKDIFRPLFNLPSPDATDGTTPSSRLNTLRGVYAVGGGPGSGICHLLC
ncbi:MAG: hypothetical protein KKB50_05315, partial [Planctomycetes bacterium]|nr:hypothetical protein [Planctomycetota bacterium]